MVRGRLRFCVGLGSEPDEGARTKRGRENVLFLRDAVHPSERFMAAKRKAHLRQDTTSDRRGVHALRDEYVRAIQPSRARADKTFNLERTLSDLVNQTCAKTPAENDLMWKTAPPRRPVAAPAT